MARKQSASAMNAAPSVTGDGRGEAHHTFFTPDDTVQGHHRLETPTCGSKAHPFLAEVLPTCGLGRDRGHEH
jgi:hypothetical protein